MSIARGVAAGKRVQAMGGAKNHGIVMPDADLDQVVADLVGRGVRLGGRALHGAAGGGAGRRRTADRAAREADPGDRRAARRRLDRRGRALRPGGQRRAQGSASRAGSRPACDEGAELVVDGRGFTLQGHEKGFFIGPTLFDHVTPEMESYQEEIFGPVLQIVRAADFEEALRLPCEHQYGNGVAIFTRNGHAAREFAARVNVGMVGINVPIPVPVAYHTLRRLEALGVRRHQPARHGRRQASGPRSRRSPQRWPDGSALPGMAEDGGPARVNDAFVIPTMG